MNTPSIQPSAFESILSLESLNLDNTDFLEMMLGYLILTRPNSYAHPVNNSEIAIYIFTSLPIPLRIALSNPSKARTQTYCDQHEEIVRGTDGVFHFMLDEFLERILKVLEAPFLFPFPDINSLNIPHHSSIDDLIKRHHILRTALNPEVSTKSASKEPNTFWNCGNCIACKLGKVFADDSYLEALLLACIVYKDSSGAFDTDCTLIRELHIAIQVHCQTVGYQVLTPSRIIQRVKVALVTLGLEGVEGSFQLFRNMTSKM